MRRSAPALRATARCAQQECGRPRPPCLWRPLARTRLDPLTATVTTIEADQGWCTPAIVDGMAAQLNMQAADFVCWFAHNALGASPWSRQGDPSLQSKAKFQALPQH